MKPGLPITGGIITSSCLGDERELGKQPISMCNTESGDFSRCSVSASVKKIHAKGSLKSVKYPVYTLQNCSEHSMAG